MMKSLRQAPHKKWVRKTLLSCWFFNIRLFEVLSSGERVRTSLFLVLSFKSKSEREKPLGVICTLVCPHFQVHLP
jgi:hypothetical protein